MSRLPERRPGQQPVERAEQRPVAAVVRRQVELTSADSRGGEVGADVGAPEAVDGLLRVADEHQRRGRGRSGSAEGALRGCPTGPGRCPGTRRSAPTGSGRGGRATAARRGPGRSAHRGAAAAGRRSRGCRRGACGARSSVRSVVRQRAAFGAGRVVVVRRRAGARRVAVGRPTARAIARDLGRARGGSARSARRRGSAARRRRRRPRRAAPDSSSRRVRSRGTSADRPTERSTCWVNPWIVEMVAASKSVSAVARVACRSRRSVVRRVGQVGEHHVVVGSGWSPCRRGRAAGGVRPRPAGGGRGRGARPWRHG